MSCTGLSKKNGHDGAPLPEHHAVDTLLDALTRLLARRVAARIMNEEEGGKLSSDAGPLTEARTITHAEL